MTKKIREELIRRAKAGQTVTYGELAPLADLDVSRPDDRNVLSEMLGEISTDEHNVGRPMLSALVVRSEEQTPRPGFFVLARELGLWNHRSATTALASAAAAAPSDPAPARSVPRVCDSHTSFHFSALL